MTFPTLCMFSQIASQLSIYIFPEWGQLIFMTSISDFGFFFLKNSSFPLYYENLSKVLNMRGMQTQEEGAGKWTLQERGELEWSRKIGTGTQGQKNVKVVVYPIHPFTFTLLLQFLIPEFECNYLNLHCSFDYHRQSEFTFASHLNQCSFYCQNRQTIASYFTAPGGLTYDIGNFCVFS